MSSCIFWDLLFLSLFLGPDFLQDHPQGGVYVKDLSAFVVKNTEEMHSVGSSLGCPCWQDLWCGESLLIPWYLELQDSFLFVCLFWFVLGWRELNMWSSCIPVNGRKWTADWPAKSFKWMNCRSGVLQQTWCWLQTEIGSSLKPSTHSWQRFLAIKVAVVPEVVIHTSKESTYQFRPLGPADLSPSATKKNPQQQWWTLQPKVDRQNHPGKISKPFFVWCWKKWSLTAYAGWVGCTSSSHFLLRALRPWSRRVAGWVEGRARASGISSILCVPKQKVIQ